MGRIANPDFARRYVLGHDSPRANDCISPDPTAREHRRVGANQCPPPDMHAAGERGAWCYVRKGPNFAMVVNCRIGVDNGSPA